MADNALSQLVSKDQMRASPRNRLAALADALTAANEYANRPDKTMPGGLANPPLSMLSGLLGLPSLATTAQRASYGEPLTNAGKANVPFLKPETADALMMAPLSPRTALGAVGLAGGMADTGAMRAATVWHGSPHMFDKFDASKIGTGEGAQAYGRGVYVAQEKAVADEYAGKLSTPIIEFGGRQLENLGLTGQDKALAEWAKRSIDTMSYGGRPAEVNRLNSFFEREHPELAKKFGKIDYGDSGSLYKIDLPDEHIAKMLDWDKPLSQQAPEVASAVAKAFPGTYVNGQFVDPANSQLTGRALLDQLAAIANKRGAPGMRAAEPALKAAGIPGIRYLDGGSRTAGQGSSNFVVFPGNENILKILSRNGQSVP